MEFDVASLQPTYRLMWGTAGASNALDIAQTLGFDSTVLAEAREVARSTLASQGERSARMAATAASLMEQLEDATAELNETRARRQAGEAAAQQLQEELRELAAAEAKLKRLPTLIVKRRDTTRQELQQLLAEFEKGRSNRAESEDAPDIGDIVVVPERHGEAQFRLSGPDSVRIEPLSATGLGAALLSFSKKGKKSGGGAITVPKTTIRLARRAMTHLPTSIPSTLDPDVRGAT
ncbi:DNA_MISMATCH_REPAIR_2 domain-containing protein [Haematococcus lacustris]|uniref:DNA_MISMATCH_REPAIR_2 domain-containing protein n=1 Tax=Haematococcus lacustris TaxID=44745 RepID=A0A6A0AAP0_HAELA|nr:DNA_MISMATCH_REPAIR_2 domain-containing protein [Haematococcus lacustris]